MTSQSIAVGVSFPTTEIGTDVLAIRDFAQAVEDMGFSHLVGYDRLLGINPANRPNYLTEISIYTHEHMFQEPLMLFSYLAGVTRNIGLVSGVIVLPQRQTLLFAKQAANVDQYCRGRLRLGVGIGQNPIEYEAMGVPYKERTARMEEQIHLLRRFWTEPWFSETGKFHSIFEAGINPLPVQRPIPIWIAGHAPAAMDRAARIGDGMMSYLDAHLAEETVGRFRELVKKHGRDPEQIRLENFVFVTAMADPRKKTGPEDAVVEIETWRKAGSREITLHTMDIGLRGVEQHIGFLRKVAGMLELGRKTA